MPPQVPGQAQAPAAGRTTPPAGPARAIPPGPLPPARPPAQPPRPAGVPAAGERPATETTARLRPVPAQPSRRRPVGAVTLGPPPGAAAYTAQPYWGPPPAEAPVETTTRLRPVRERHPGRTRAALACLVLGLGCIGGAGAGAWLVDDADTGASSRTAYSEARTLWHSAPVDTLFPRTLRGDGAGPGRADRVWSRVAVAPDGPCTGALDPLLVKALQPVGCARVLRATYTDATSTSVTTVGMVFTEADAPAMATLHARFGDESLDERTDLMPRTLPAPGTVAAGFGDKQRASWRVRVLTEAPVVVYAVSGFADGRTVPDPQPAAEAMAGGRTTAPAQAGLGHEAKGIADRIERGLRTAVARRTAEEPT
ncbi:hypothetical protein ACF1G0_09810 [Streptomyces sp. NPDC013953]|uniref:hypothetical protein n=1 Tax=Streptomyces sp. NPDC013953 TaxID=3364868 RepID=UPI0036FC960D